MTGKVILIIIATINQNEKEALNHYLQEMGKMYQEVEAVPISKYKVSEALMGDNSANLVSIMEFPSREAIDRVFQSEAYKKLVPFREKAFMKVEALISE